MDWLNLTLVTIFIPLNIIWLVYCIVSDIKLRRKWREQRLVRMEESIEVLIKRVGANEAHISNNRFGISSLERDKQIETARSEYHID